jgi:hypothetical protein
MNQNHFTKSNSTHVIIPIIKLVKWTYLPYLAILLLVFFDSLWKYPTDLLKAVIGLNYASGWGYVIIMGPFISIVVGIEYFLRKTTLANIPKDTTLYAAITKPSVMYGPLKMIYSNSDSESDPSKATELE